MSDSIHSRILSHLKSPAYRPQAPKKIAAELELNEDEWAGAFHEALQELMNEGRVVLGARGAVLLPSNRTSPNEFTGSYRHNKRGFGFVVPQDPTAHEDLFIPEGQNLGAITGDIVRAKITSQGHKDGKVIYSGRISEIIERTQKKFVALQLETKPEGSSIKASSAPALIASSKATIRLRRLWEFKRMSNICAGVQRMFEVASARP